MISANCDIREFITGLENKDFFEMIYLLDQEATDAERQLYNPKSEISERQICGPEYVSKLKNIIFYLRYGAKPRGLRQEDISLLESVYAKSNALLQD
jgi:hypothetical protein